jgi:ubiquinone/menaquinone biosynthesis C-methylase UbiE
MASEARYDAVADYYAAGWPDDLGDAVSVCLLGLVGDVAGRRVLELACGHGRVARELARRGATVVGVDMSDRLLGMAVAEENSAPLGIRYVYADVAEAGLLAGDTFDAVVCSFGLSDIDDLDGALGNAHRLLREGGSFVFSILHPCFPGDTSGSGSWPSDGGYHDER